ncbi:homeobox protein HMX3-like [Daphnia carinata]|uniref:homeobox protein HMX3-like n=1 Tax=Daphnia carinata TaxID=120202 RepID=UPI00257E7BB0|nr:homeobox protein HMX3-like [Daphnia carinata]
MENQINQSLSFANLSDEPLDLSLRKNQRETENDNPDVSVKRLKVTAKLWQTREVMRPQVSLQRIVSDRQRSEMNAVEAITPESLPKDREKDRGTKDLDSRDSSKVRHPPKKRKRFTITELFVLEKVFEVKMFVTPREIQEVARLLDIENDRIKHWFQARRQKWKKETPCRKESVAALVDYNLRRYENWKAHH